MKIATAVALVVPTTALVAAAAARGSSRRRLGGLGYASRKTKSAKASPKRSKSKRSKSKRTVPAKPGVRVDALEPTARDESTCLILGRSNPHYPFGPYEVCLTNNQQETLFHGFVGEKLGCGTFACAFKTRDPDKVVKITRDPQDVAALLRAQGSGMVPKVHAVYTLGSDEAGKGVSTETGNRTPAYALVVERLKTLNDIEKRESRKMFDVVNDYHDGKIDLHEACASNPRIVCKAVKAAAELKHRTGIKWTDAHYGNIGYGQDGKLKILDLGITKTALKEKPRILEGAVADRLRKQLAGIVRRAL